VKVSRTQVIRRLRDAGLYYTKKRGKRTELWRRRASVERVPVALCDYFDEMLVTVTLGQAGLSRDEIKRFWADCVKQ
jgi:hypothetical protein